MFICHCAYQFIVLSLISWNCATATRIGFQNLPHFISDMNECTGTPGNLIVDCLPNAYCVNKEPGFDCLCNAGFEIINNQCVGECADTIVAQTRMRSDLHRSVHSFMLFVLTVRGLPRPLLPFILPSISNRCRLSLLIICPKYWHFLFVDGI